jgi:hypothetical protein
MATHASGTSAVSAPNWRAQWRPVVDRVFTDRLMTELAVLLIPVTVLPIIFPFSPAMLQLFAVTNAAVIIAFALELK